LCRIEGLIQHRRIPVSDIADELNISVGVPTFKEIQNNSISKGHGNRVLGPQGRASC
jgi:hypothetical protein